MSIVTIINKSIALLITLLNKEVSKSHAKQSKLLDTSIKLNHKAADDVAKLREVIEAIQKGVDERMNAEDIKLDALVKSRDEALALRVKLEKLLDVQE